MDEAQNQFKRAPRRKAARGRTVTLSAEVKQAYADLLQERHKREIEYGRHLPADDKRR